MGNWCVNKSKKEREIRNIVTNEIKANDIE
jgi:hypothetical protein